MAFLCKMARNAFPHCREWRLEKEEWKGAAERAEILGEGKELKGTVDSEPPDASENEMYSSVVCYCLPGTSTSPMNDTSLDFQVLAQAQQACSLALSESCLLGFKRRRWPVPEASSDGWQPQRQPLLHRSCQSPTTVRRPATAAETGLWLFQERGHDAQWRKNMQTFNKIENTLWGRRK